MEGSNMAEIIYALRPNRSYVLLKRSKNLTLWLGNHFEVAVGLLMIFEIINSCTKDLIHITFCKD